MAISTSMCAPFPYLYMNETAKHTYPRLPALTSLLSSPCQKEFIAKKKKTPFFLWNHRINLPNLKHVAFLKIKSTGDIDCRALGKNLSSLVFHPREFDVGKGFTCYTYDEQNRYNSSDPTGSGPANPTSSEPYVLNPYPLKLQFVTRDILIKKNRSEGVSVRVGYLAALFSLVAMAIF